MNKRNGRDDARWEKAVTRARNLLDQYKRIGPPGFFGTIVIGEALDLHEQGDRSDQLLEKMERFK